MLRKTHFFRLRGFHPLRLAFPCHSPRNAFFDSLGLLRLTCRSHDTDTATPVSLTLYRFRLFPVRSPLLGESRLLYFPAGTKMFQFPAFPPLAQRREIILGRFPGLGDLRITACLAASRSLSQLSHVLQRLWTPRHPPYTLSSLTTLFACVRNTLLGLWAQAQRRTVLPRFPNSLCFQRTRSAHAGRCAFSITVTLTEAASTAMSLGVEAKGLEPTTPWLQTRCSTN